MPTALASIYSPTASAASFASERRTMSFFSRTDTNARIATTAKIVPTTHFPFFPAMGNYAPDFSRRDKP